MDLLFKEFSTAYSGGQGYGLAETLSPVPPSSQPDKLRRFYRSTNFQSVRSDFQYRLLYDNSNPVRLDAIEGKAWVEIYCSYWSAIGELLEAEAAILNNQKVKFFVHAIYLSSLNSSFLPTYLPRMLHITMHDT